ncbi:MAG: histidine kinase N-terminal 7TM domain-containing protein [Clostridiales bacterium]
MQSLEEFFQILSLLVHITLFIMIALSKFKSQLHYMFMLYIFSIFLWSFLRTFSSVIYNIYKIENNILHMNLDSLALCSLIFTSVFFLFLSKIFVKTKIEFDLKNKIIFIIPIIVTVLVWTNKYHNLFYKKYSYIGEGNEYGILYIINILYSYILIMYALYQLISFCIRNSGFYSRQAVIFIIGASSPILINILYTIDMVREYERTVIIFISITSVLYFFSVFRYKLLTVMPIALNRVVQNMSEGFIVINEYFNIVNYNRAVKEGFLNSERIMINRNIFDFLNSIKNFNRDLIGIVKSAIYNGKVSSKQCSVKLKGNKKFFRIEVLPIAEGKNGIGAILIFKDITDHINYIDFIRKNNEVSMERERLASLGQLIGGLSHNLRTPIMSISGGMDCIKDLIGEYNESIGDESVTIEDHKEICKELIEWTNKIIPQVYYISDVIKAVREQAVNSNLNESSLFSINELLDRIEMLVKFTLDKILCELTIKNEIKSDLYIEGEATVLVQIINNIVLNAVDSYKKTDVRKVNLIIRKNHSCVVFIIRDYGKGIPVEIREKIFKEMITTKGMKGTGLGLYISYSLVKGKFKGDIWFESHIGKGTTFYISIPYQNK